MSQYSIILLLNSSYPFVITKNTKTDLNFIQEIFKYLKTSLDDFNHEITEKKIYYKDKKINITAEKSCNYKTAEKN